MTGAPNRFSQDSSDGVIWVYLYTHAISSPDEGRHIGGITASMMVQLDQHINAGPLKRSKDPLVKVTYGRFIAGDERLSAPQRNARDRLNNDLVRDTHGSCEA